MDVTRQPRLMYGMTEGGVQWLWKGNVEPEAELLDLDAYARTCILRLRDAWQGLNKLISSVVDEPAGHQAAPELSE